jgi:uridine kinase
LVARWETAGPEAVLVIDGEFLLRPELRRMWNASILLVNAPERAVYEEDARPRDFATILVDESDPVVPVRVPRPESA